jgi:membrane glycosyltransferase
MASLAAATALGRAWGLWSLALIAPHSGLLDPVVFTLLAHVLMIFHSRFVIYTILGKGVRWVTQRRKLDGGVDWVEILLNFWPVSVLGLAWGVVAWFVSPAFLLWISPILISLLLAIPVAVLVSGTRTGRRFNLFLTPEEAEPPGVLQAMEQNLDEVKGRLRLQPELERFHGLMQVFLDPYINGLHVSLLRRRRNIDVSRGYLDEIAARLIQQGPQSLTTQEIKAMIHDTDTVTNLHYRLWSAAEHELAPFWITAIRQYNLATGGPALNLRRIKRDSHREGGVRVGEAGVPVLLDQSLKVVGELAGLDGARVEVRAPRRAI